MEYNVLSNYDWAEFLFKDINNLTVIERLHAYKYLKLLKICEEQKIRLSYRDLLGEDYGNDKLAYANLKEIYDLLSKNRKSDAFSLMKKESIRLLSLIKFYNIDRPIKYLDDMEFKIFLDKHVGNTEVSEQMRQKK